jgi:F-type H+-transporting ATPase subunit delta
MNNPRLASRYAKSILDLAVEKNQLDEVYKDMQFILQVCKTNQAFVALLRSPVIKEREKAKVLEYLANDKVGPLTTSFIKLLVAKTRELNLPEIAASFVEQYNEIRDIHKVKITTAVPISEDLKKSIVVKSMPDVPLERIELESVVDDSLIGGIILEVEGRLIDASIRRELREVKMQFLNNDYLHKIR